MLSLKLFVYLILLPNAIVGLFTIKFNGYRIWEVEKIPTDQPMPVKHGRVRGNKSIFKVGLIKFHLDWYHTGGSQKQGPS